MTEDEIIEEIAEITAALKHILKGGQEYTIDSGGSRRSVTMADYETLIKRRNQLRIDLKAVQGDAGMTMSAGW